MRTRVGRGGLVAAAAVLLLANAAPASALTSHPGHTSYWAFVTQRVAAKSGPSWGSGNVATIDRRTEDRTQELVFIETTRTDDHGNTWLRVRLPIRPSGQVGWLPRRALSNIHKVKTWLQVDKAALRATLIRNGRTVLTAPVGVGKPESPTPEGDFYVRDKLDGVSLGTIYGPVAFGTSAKSSVLTDWPGGGVIGIHGTNEPGLLPGVVSHGCIRMRNRDVSRLARRMPVGTPLTIH